MKKKNIFIIIIIFITTIILFANISNIYANPIANAIDSAKEFGNTGKSDIINYEGLHTVINFLYNIVMIIAVIVAIIVGIKIGIGIIWGSLDEKADAKHLLVPYIIIVTFASLALTIWRTALGLMSNF